MRQVYMDHNATTPVHPEVLEAMMPFFKDQFGNSSSIHWAGRQVKKYLDEAREKVERVERSLGGEPAKFYRHRERRTRYAWVCSGRAILPGR